MKSLKVNQIEKARLSKTEMAYVTGGESCGCACRYANAGGGIDGEQQKCECRQRFAFARHDSHHKP